MIAGALLFTIRSGAVALLQRRAVSAKSKSIFRCRRRRSPRRRRPLRGSGNTAPAPEAVATNNRGGRRIPGGSGGDRGRDSCRVPGAAVRCRLSRPAGRWPRLRRHRGRTIRDRSAKGRSRQARTSSDGIRSRLSAEDLGRSAPLRGRREHSSAYWRAPSGSVGKGLPTYKTGPPSRSGILSRRLHRQGIADLRLPRVPKAPRNEEGIPATPRNCRVSLLKPDYTFGRLDIQPANSEYLARIYATHAVSFFA